MKINKALAEEAKTKGICREWYAKLRDTEDRHALVKMFLGGIDFCLSEDYPSAGFFRMFDGVRQLYGIFRDEAIDIENSDSESSGLLDLPKMKPPYSVNWPDCHGQVVDLSRKRYEVREIELKCWIKATGMAMAL